MPKKKINETPEENQDNESVFLKFGVNCLDLVLLIVEKHKYSCVIKF